MKKESEPLYKTPKSIQETIEIMAVAENGIFERYCEFLNSLDCNYKITINNKNKNMEDLRDKVLITEKTMDSIITEESTMTLLRRRLLRADRGLNRKDT